MKRVFFLIVGLLKTSRPCHTQDRLVLKAYNQNKSICIVNYTREYSKRKANMMNIGHDANNLYFFVSYRPPHRSATVSTIPRWVLEVMRQSGIDTNVIKAHSTGGAGTSAARDMVPIDVILTSEGWSSRNIFVKFYEREVTRVA